MRNNGKVEEMGESRTGFQPAGIRNNVEALIRGVNIANARKTLQNITFKS
jgi:hypothetical protein